ncbi:MAG TPA: lipase family protein [Acidimicrobiales bacterium]
MHQIQPVEGPARAGSGRGSRRCLGRLGAIGSLAVIAAMAVSGCGSPASPSFILPSFYSVPSHLPSNAPGTLVKSQKVPSGAIHGTVYRVMYVSEDVHGAPVLVTGLVMVPNTPAPAGGYPVVSWGHGTNGMADQCAPSLAPSSAVPEQNALLAKGWEVTASDYQGEGTPGLLPYVVGVSAARNTIDIVRAALHLAAAKASTNYVVWGHSEGGQTAMFALAIGGTYAPELSLKGVVAGAPPSQFQFIYDFLKTSPFRYYLLMVGAGWNSAYGNTVAPLSEVATPKAISLLPILEKGCAGYIAAQTKQYSISQLIKVDPATVPAWKQLETANDPGQLTTASPAPLLIIQGGNDEQIPVATTLALEQHECGIGQEVQRWVYPGFNHAGVIAPSVPDMVQWINDRFAGAASPDPYQPTGATGINITNCTGSNT